MKISSVKTEDNAIEKNLFYVLAHHLSFDFETREV